MTGLGARARAGALAIATVLAVSGLSLVAVRSVPALPNFPGAEGFGTTTAGGRGGRVIAVTNLNDSGAGSFRAALEASGPRIVVFKVSGTINLNDDINLVNPYISVLGQTAPGGGITLKSDFYTATSGLLDIHTHDVVIRFLRFRSGTFNGPNEGNPITIYKPDVYNVVIDHNSISWGVNENLTTYDYARDITMSWNIISEGLNNAGHPSGAHSRGLFMSGDSNTGNQSAHHNLLAHNDRRNPEIGITGTADFVNNIVYNWGAKAGLATDKYFGTPLNFVGNYYKPGPSSTSGYELDIFHGNGICNSTLRIYPRGNIGPNRPNDTLPEERVIEPDPCWTLASTANPAPPITTTTAEQAYDDVLARAGAVFPFRDAVDDRVIGDVRNGTGRIIDDPSEVGGWPGLPAGVAPPDADNDGMPDEWETARGLNPVVDDSAGDRDGDGYSNIEEYANGLVAHLVPSPGPAPSPSPEPSPSSSPAPEPSPSPTAEPTTSPSPSPSPSPSATASPSPTPPAPQTFVATDDGSVYRSKPRNKFGSKTTLEADRTPEKESYLLFDLSSLTGPIQSATLRLWVTDATDDGPTLFQTASGWSEASLTWNTRPALTSAAIGDLGSTSRGMWVTYDVTALLTGPGAYGFALLPGSADQVTFSSSEASSNRPHLLVT